MRHVTFLLLLLALPFTALAQDCGSDSAQRIAKAYQQRPAGTLPERTGWTLATDRAACRVWPADTTLTLMAVPVLGPEDQHGAPQEGDLDLLVVDSATLRPRASVRLPDVMSSDAIRVDGVSLDTARYRLSTDKRAFGVRVTRNGLSRANPFSDTRLQLFVLNGNALDAVTGQMVVNHFGGEWDTRCAGEFSQLTRMLDVGPLPAQGFAELKVRERSYRIRSHEDGAGNCLEDRIEQPGHRYRLRPQAHRYPIPPALEAAF
ncbi:MAG: hypothetical protein ACOH1V_03610 [Stenotrophomonas sp.]